MLTPDEIKILGKAMARARFDRGWSLKRLARESGIAPQSVRSFERGARSTRLATIDTLLVTLGLTRETLLHPKAPNDPRIEGLNPEDLDIARQYHHGSTPVRARVQRELSRGDDLGSDAEGPILERLATMLTQFPPEDRARVLEGIEMMLRTMVPSTTPDLARAFPQRAKKG